MKCLKFSIFIFVIVLLLACNLFTKNNTFTGQPNIIFVLADDLRWDGVGYAGNPVIQTPAIDSLANQGTKFKNAYVTTSICSVSRASILSGQYARQHGKWGFGPGFGVDEWNKTYPAQLNTAGYRTGFIGKYGVGEYAFASQQFDYWKGFNGQGSFDATDDNGNPIHLIKLMENQAVEFIEANPANQCFSLSISFKAPHVENDSDNWQKYNTEYEDEYEAANFPQQLSGEVEYFNHFPEDFLEENEARERYVTRFGNPQKGQASLEGYYRLIHGIDRAMSEIVAALEANGYAENTIIIFTSDNGMYLGEYGFSGKWYGSEPSIRVPMFIYDPINNNTITESSELALNIDIAPTILEYAGISIPNSMQGKSLKPIVTNELIDPWREDFLYEHLWAITPGYKIPSVEGVVNDSTKYMRYFNGFDFTPIIHEELYEKNIDSNEINNLAQSVDYQEVKSILQTRLNEIIDEVD